MSKHPYPDHIVEAMTLVYENHWAIPGTKSWECSCDNFKTPGTDGNAQNKVLQHITEVMLEALWDASRVDTVEQLDALPDEAVINDGYFTQTKDVNQWTGGFHQFAKNDQIDLPAHVIYWGDTDE